MRVPLVCGFKLLPLLLLVVTLHEDKFFFFAFFSLFDVVGAYYLIQ